MRIWRGSTPSLTVVVDGADITGMDYVRLDVACADRTIKLTKDRLVLRRLAEDDTASTEVTAKLTEDETLSLRGNASFRVQLRAGKGSGEDLRIVTDTATGDVGEIVVDGAL